MVDLETLNNFMCSDKKAHVLGLGMGIFSQLSKKTPESQVPSPACMFWFLYKICAMIALLRNSELMI